MRQGRLSIPAVLTVSALGLGCPADDGGDTGDASSDGVTSEATTTASTTGGVTTGGTTEATGSSSEGGSGTGSSTGDGSSSTGIELPDCFMYEEETTCAAEPLCQWVTGLGCRAECEMLGTMHVCVESEFCYWFEEACHTPI